MKTYLYKLRFLVILVTVIPVLLAIYFSREGEREHSFINDLSVERRINASAAKTFEFTEIDEILKKIREDPFYKDRQIYIKFPGGRMKLYFYSYTVEPFWGKTDVYVNNSKTPQLLLDGYFYNAYGIDVNSDGKEELEIETESGHSLNSLIYKYLGGRLERIPVSTENPKGWKGIVSRNAPEFKDVNKDGLLEMLAYYRFFPPEKKRKVEVYKFTGVLFQKVREYEEKMPEVYL